MASQLHPYIASATSPFLRLVRAYYWFVMDMDFRHADYWRSQIRQIETDMLLDGYDDSFLLLAMRQGYEMASRRPFFGSCSVSTTATKSHG